MTRQRIRGSGKDLNRYLDSLRREGLEVELGGGGHWHVRRDGRLVTSIPVSPSDKNIMHIVRRAVRRGLARLDQEKGECDA